MNPQYLFLYESQNSAFSGSKWHGYKHSGFYNTLNDLGHTWIGTRHISHVTEISKSKKKKSKRYSGHLTARKTPFMSCSHQKGPNSYCKTKETDLKTSLKCCLELFKSMPVSIFDLLGCTFASKWNLGYILGIWLEVNLKIVKGFDLWLIKGYIGDKYKLLIASDTCYIMCFKVK